MLNIWSVVVFDLNDRLPCEIILYIRFRTTAYDYVKPEIWVVGEGEHILKHAQEA